MAEDTFFVERDEGEERSEDEFEVDGDAKKKRSSVVYDEMSPNLVEVFEDSEDGKKALKKISDQVFRDFEAAWEASENYRQQVADDLKLLVGDLPAKSFPFDGCANAHVPIALENISRLVYRASSELFNDWSNVAGVLPIHSEDDGVANVLTKHINWQLRHQITDFRRQVGSRGLMNFFFVGDVVCHSYYDPVRGRNCHDILNVDEFFCPFVYASTEPDFSDVPYLGKILHRYKHEIQRMRGEWYGVDEVLKHEKPSWDDEPDQITRQSAAEYQGVEADDEVRAPYKLIEYYGWCDLPNQEDERYVKVIMDHRTKNILLLQIHEEDDWQDRVRFEREQADLDRYRQMTAEHQGMMAQAQQMMAMPQPDAMMDPQGAMMHQQAIQQMMSQPPPTPPPWVEGDPMMAQPAPIKRVPIRMFSHAVCIEPMSGSLGIGYGRIQCDFNRAANVALSQFIDAATLANSKTLLTTEQVEFDRPQGVQPGMVSKVKGVGPSELNSAIKELSFSPANDQLVNVVKMMFDWGQSSIQAPSVLSGEPGKSGETYRGISTRVEQATRQLSVVTRKYADFVEQVLKNNAKLNAQFLRDEEIIFLNDTKAGGGEELVISRKMYERDYRVEIRADLRFASQAQRIQEADELVQMPGAVPPLQQDVAFVYATVRKALEARNRHELVPLLGPPPPAPETTFGAPPPAPPGMAPPGMGPGGPGGPPGGPGGPPDGGVAPGQEAVQGPGGPARRAPQP